MKAPRHWDLWREFTDDRWNDPHKKASNAEIFPFDDVIMRSFRPLWGESADLRWNPFIESQWYEAVTFLWCQPELRVMSDVKRKFDVTLMNSHPDVFFFKCVSYQFNPNLSRLLHWSVLVRLSMSRTWRIWVDKSHQTTKTVNGRTATKQFNKSVCTFHVLYSTL